MVGYLTAIVALGGGIGPWVTIASFLPPFSPFVMLARLMVSAVEPWQVALSIGILVASIAVVAVVATPDVRGGRAAVRAAAGDPRLRARRRARPERRRARSPRLSRSVERQAG